MYTFVIVLILWDKTFAGSDRSHGPRVVYQKSKLNELPIDSRNQYNIYII